MIIPEEILDLHGAIRINFPKGDYIFYENDPPQFYYQVISGMVKMCTFSSDGQEFIQGIFNAGESFGEPAIFANFPFPSNAIAMELSTVVKLPVDRFMDILKNDFNLTKKFTFLLSERLRYKSMVLKEISSYDPDHILMTMLAYIRNNHGENESAKFLIPYTRQQLADMTGLRVETVIRTIKKLAREGRLEIQQHKIFLK
jgi:CRP/FNR family transcriptional regulator, cyclic AMP receptor protein